MPNFTVIDNTNNVINLDEKLDAKFDTTENSELLKAVRALRGDDIQGLILVGFKRDGGIELSVTSNCFSYPAETVYAAELVKNLIINNADFDG
mgnify:CR=1 FL=1